MRRRLGGAAGMCVVAITVVTGSVNRSPGRVSVGSVVRAGGDTAAGQIKERGEAVTKE
jgi:hypothetical protein